MKKLTTEEFIKRAREIHCNKYDYSETIYTDSLSDVCIICPQHGKFYQRACNHLNGYECPECGKIEKSKNNTKSTEKFIEKAKEVHGNKYDYSKVAYKKANEKVTIICPTHGEFQQTPHHHLEGSGCPLCAREEQKDKIKFTTETFIEKATEVHNGKYTYEDLEYNGARNKVKITCPTHGIFEQEAESHLRGCGCPKCITNVSNGENEIAKFLIDNGIEIIQNDRNTISPQELDIFIPSKNIAIEYDGLYWHSEACNTDNLYHLKKTEECKKKNIQLIHIFEDEWVNKQDIAKNKLLHILKQNNNLPKIMGRKCIINEISNDTAKQFLETYHIQGFARSTTYFGAFCEDILVGVMTFKEITKNSGKYELNRFASNYNYVCQGIGGKLFKYFIKEYNPTEVKSFADRRWTLNEENNLYTSIGFNFEGYIKPDYHYYNTNTKELRRIHKFNFRKKTINKKYGLPLTMTEDEMTNKLKIYKIWDCGLIKYVWKK